MPIRSHITALLLVACCLTFTLVACAGVFLVNPYHIFASSTPTATHTPSPTATPSATATATATPTPSATATVTPSPSSTPTATSTPTPSVTPSPTATATATPHPETFLPTAPEAVPNCGVTMLKGQVRSADALLNGVPIHVWWEGSDGVHSLPSGHDPTKPDGYWDVVLEASAKAGRWFAAAVDPVSLAHISPAVMVETDAEPCAPESEGRQIVTVDFVLQGQQVGNVGPTLTPSPTPTPTFTPTPYPTPDGQSRAVRVPILMYHYVSHPPPGANRYRHDLSVSPELFRTHLAYLRDRGYQTISVHDLVYALTRGTPLPPNPVILTFDDGYRDNYDNAFPILREFGFRGTFFVVTDFVTEGRAEYMTWDQLREMHAAGMEIGSHSRDHPDLRSKSDAYLIWEILGSSQAIEAHLGVRPEVFSYPSGRYDQRTMDVVRASHYWAAVTTKGGMVHTTEDLLTLERIRVRGGWTPADIQRVLDHWARNGQ